MNPIKQSITLIALLIVAQTAFAQKPIGSSNNSGGSESDKLKQPVTATTQKGDFEVYIDSVSMVLSMPMYGGGHNGAGVAYDPERKLYYSGIAGNVKFPMVVFNAKGDVITDTLTAKFDLRGLWYNSKTKTIEANGYGDFGIISYNLNRSGIPIGTKTVFGEKCQPEDNSVGAYDPVHNEIIYFTDGILMRYDRTTGKYVGEIDLRDTDADLFNPTVVYTGIKGSELAFISYDEAIIYMFDISTGICTKHVNLPYDAIVESMFNFSFANGMFWLFDTEYREWYGYKMP